MFTPRPGAVLKIPLGKGDPHTAKPPPGTLPQRPDPSTVRVHKLPSPHVFCRDTASPIVTFRPQMSHVRCKRPVGETRRTDLLPAARLRGLRAPWPLLGSLQTSLHRAGSFRPRGPALSGPSVGGCAGLRGNAWPRPAMHAALSQRPKGRMRSRLGRSSSFAMRSVGRRLKAEKSRS